MGEKTQENPVMGYSAAYPAGRERMLEPRYGCIGESSCVRSGASPKASPKGPQGVARGALQDF